MTSAWEVDVLRSCDRMTTIRTFADKGMQTGQDSDKLWVQKYWANTWTRVSRGLWNHNQQEHAAKGGTGLSLSAENAQLRSEQSPSWPGNSQTTSDKLSLLCRKSSHSRQLWNVYNKITSFPCKHLSVM